MSAPTHPDDEFEYIDLASSKRLMREQTDTGYYMSVKEFHRIQDAIKGIREPLQWPKTLAWSAGALGAGAILTFIPWTATYGLLSTADQLSYAWVSTTLLLVPVFAAVLIGACAFFLQGHKNEVMRDKQRVLDLLDVIYQRYEPKSPADD
jgi:hypothetical protein